MIWKYQWIIVQWKWHVYCMKLDSARGNAASGRAYDAATHTIDTVNTIDAATVVIVHVDSGADVGTGRKHDGGAASRPTVVAQEIRPTPRSHGPASHTRNYPDHVIHDAPFNQQSFLDICHIIFFPLCLSMILFFCFCLIFQMGIWFHQFQCSMG